MQIQLNGDAAYAYTAGRDLKPGQPTVVFIHGAAMDHSVWILQSRYFAYHGYNVLALDLPGHGRSDGPLLTRVDVLADWLWRLLDTVGVDSVSLVGHSMGSLIATEAAAGAPERVTHLALLGAAMPMAVSDALLSAAKANDHLALDMVNVWGHGARAHFGGHPVPGLWMAGAGIRLLERAAPDVLYTDLKACNDYRSGLERAKSVTCPVMLLLGREDMMTPPRAAAPLVEAFPDSRSVVLDRCGHSMMVERSDAVLEALAGFL
jgi:pimeloyl-ACP methyl ester carboxylesterase